MVVVRVDSDGRLTVPEDALRALGVEGSGEVSIEVDTEHETVVLRPVDHDDGWLQTDPEVRASIARGLADLAAGRVRPATEAELRAMAPTDP